MKTINIAISTRSVGIDRVAIITGLSSNFSDQTGSKPRNKLYITPYTRIGPNFWGVYCCVFVDTSKVYTVRLTP